MEDEKYAPACPKLEQSQKLDPQLGTLLHLGHCYEKLGQAAAAYQTFLAAAELAALRNRQGINEPREKLARVRATSLEARLSLLELRPADSSPELTVTLDGSSDKNHQVGEMNGGGGLLTVKANSGAINIKAIK